MNERELFQEAFLKKVQARKLNLIEQMKKIRAELKRREQDGQV